jgi:hypothetical protein
MITAERLKEVLRYEPETGLFYRLVRSGPSMPGSIAGGKCGNGYVLISIDNKQHYAHRLAWLYITGKMPENLIDHKNMDKADNRFQNLREATHSQNIANKKSYGKSGFKGVTWWARDNNWKAQIEVNGKNKHIGYFNTPEEAHEAYCVYQSQIAGEFARV